MESQFINDDELLFNDKSEDKLDCEFAHFNSIELCNDFAIYMINIGYKITHKCCDGKGCGITPFNISNADFYGIKNN